MSDVAVSRNAACPCGSGLRYKACHGRADAARPFDEAQAEGALTRGLAAFDRGHAIEAVAVLAPVARSLRTAAASATFARRFWQQYAFVLGEAAARVDTQRAFAGNAVDAGDAIDPIGAITVALIVGPATSAWRTALASLRTQGRRPDEVLVVDRGALDAEAIDVALADWGIPARRLDCRGVDLPTAVDAAIGAVEAGAVALLDGDHAFGPRHLARLLDAAHRERRAWAFGRIEVVNAAGEALAADRDGAAALAARSAADVEQADTVGAAFVAAAFPPVVGTNLVASRAVLARVGPCAGRGPLWAWSLALDLVRVAEPAFASDASLRVPDAAIATVAGDAAQAALFRAWHARALAPAIPPNPLSPSPRAFGDAYFRVPLQSGHILVFDPREIDALADRVLRWAGAPALPRSPGVTFAGFAFGEIGLGENVRALARACESAGLPFDLRDVGVKLSARQADTSMASRVARRYARAATVFCVNPDELRHVDDLIDHARNGGGRVAGFWFWELDRIPVKWERCLDRVDEVWVATSFVAGAVRAATSKPVVVVPTPVEVHRARDYSRAEFGLPDGVFCFLFTFDYGSRAPRKNAGAVVDAFRRAFGSDRRDVALAIKSSNAGNHPRDRAALLAKIGDDPRIVAFDRFLPRDAVWGLQAACDCYVSLHRSEGLGLGLAESMLQGKPAIATRWSGNLDFMTDDNSALVDFTLVPVREGEYPGANTGLVWADPDIDHAALLMRRMADDRAWRETLAARGQRDVRERLSPASTAERIRARLAEIGAL